MDIAIVGAGAIGSTFAYHLAQAGHAVTVVARGARLAYLQREQAIVLVTGERAPVTVEGALDEKKPYDLVLVTVLATQVDAVLPALTASAAAHVMFMFNTFEPIDRLRDAVGAQRFVFGFPSGIFTLIIDGKIKKQVNGGNTMGDAAWAKVFTDAGIPSVTEDDMHSWLRTHVALVAPLMSVGAVVATRGAGITWQEAGRFADAMTQAFRVVRELGNSVRPKSAASVDRLPRLFKRAMLWVLSRTAVLRDLGKLGPAEPRILIDMMTAAAPGKTDELVAIRP